MVKIVEKVVQLDNEKKKKKIFNLSIFSIRFLLRTNIRYIL